MSLRRNIKVSRAEINLPQDIYRLTVTERTNANIKEGRMDFIL